LISANITREITKVKQYIYKTYKHGPKKNHLSQSLATAAYYKYH